MTIIKWILAVCFALLAMVQLPDNIVGFVLLAIAFALVLPPLNAAITNSVTFLKSNALRIFLAVVLGAIALSMAGSSAVYFTDIAVCSADSKAACSADQPFFLEGNSPVTITATAKEGTADSIENMAVEISYVPAPGIEATSVLSDSLAPAVKGDNVTVTLSELPLMVGSYEIEIAPEIDGEKTTLPKKAAFTVWPTQAEVDQRLTSEVGSQDFADIISENFVCVYDGDAVPEGEDLITTEAPKSELKSCDDTEPLPLGNTPIAFDYGFSRSLETGASLTSILRYLPEGENMIEVYSDTTELEAGLDRYASLDELSAEVPAGNYEMISVINTPNAKPIRLEFEIVE